MRFLSILIPTRNRQQLARLAVAAALHEAEDDCEVVVADNSDERLHLPVDPRLKHLPPVGVLSMPDNWERALRECRGEWIMLLSDKFMLVPGAIEALRRLGAAPSMAVRYGYGVLHQRLSADQEEDLELLRTKGGVLRWASNPDVVATHDSRAALAAVYRKAAYPGEYPMLYTALVHRQIAEQAFLRGGRFFRGSCPDVASALQILAGTERYLATRLPVAMIQYPSSSPKWSTGSSTLTDGGLRDRFFSEFGVGQVGRHAATRLLVAGAVFETLLDFAQARSDLGVLLQPSWTEFAKVAAREIESHALRERFGLHRQLLSFTQRDRTRPVAAYAQVQATLATHLPRPLVNSLLRLRERLGGTGSPMDGEGQQPTLVVESREGAMAVLSRILREAGSGLRLGGAESVNGDLGRGCEAGRSEV